MATRSHRNKRDYETYSQPRTQGLFLKRRGFSDWAGSHYRSKLPRNEEGTLSRTFMMVTVHMDRLPL